MSKKGIWITVLGLVMLLALSGCFSNRYAVQHNPDGSGILTLESVFTVEYLGLFDDGTTMEEAQDEILSDGVLSPDDLPDDPNIRSATEEAFIDPTTGALHHILTIEIIDILQPIYFDATIEEDTTLFRIEDYGDGTYLFTAIVETVSEFMETGFDDEFTMEEEGFELLLQGSNITWEILVGEFIEGDPLAEFDPATSTISWEVPTYDVLFGPEPVQIFAIYRLTQPPIEEPAPEEVIPPAPEVVDPEDAAPPPEDGAPEESAPPPEIATPEPAPPPEETDQGILARSWIPLALAAVLCLGLIFVVIVIVVIILVVRGRKKGEA